MNSTHGNVAGDPVNDATAKMVRTRSRFPSMSMHFYNTDRFGEYTPFEVIDCIEGDRMPIRSGGRVSTLSLKAPLQQSIFKKKDYYMVPMEAILPFNWQKFYTNPVIGDDVSDDVGTGVSEFWAQIASLQSALEAAIYTLVSDAGQTYSKEQLLTAVIRYAVILEYFYSQGSLIKSLRGSGNRFFKYRVNSKESISFDTWFDLMMSSIVAGIPMFWFNYDGTQYAVVNDEANYGYLRTSAQVLPFRTFLQLMRDDLTTYVDTIPDLTWVQVEASFVDYMNENKYHPEKTYDSSSYDLRRLWAYQLTCAHFYSNDHIDFIYSADLYRSLISDLVFRGSNNATTISTFSYNGVAYSYDAMSAYCFLRMVSRLSNDALDCLVVHGNRAYHERTLAYFSSLFAYRRSLRYVDYFTGARSQPLAVGDVSVNVNNNVVDVVDVTKNIMKQRFLNAVNRFGRKFENYIEGLSGVKPDQDWHNPLYLAHTSDTVFGIEVENTGAAQQTDANSITSRLMSNGSRYQFEFSVDRPCVVIGISYYDMPRAYLFATERQLHHMNRFDMFNPFMQFIGDQAVDFSELGSNIVVAPDVTFGYQLRHMEYKQRYDQAAGGFVEALPGFLFTDREFGNFGFEHIDPDYIRSLNSELDGFFVSLTAYSLGHYFHFIVDNDNVCDASRPMAYAPSIL